MNSTTMSTDGIVLVTGGGGFIGGHLVASLIAALLASPAVSQAPGDDLARAQARHQDETLRARRLRADANAIALEVERLRVELLRLGQDESGDVAVISAQRARGGT